jgi:hypothetical protein
MQAKRKVFWKGIQCGFISFDIEFSYSCTKTIKNAAFESNDKKYKLKIIEFNEFACTRCAFGKSDVCPDWNFELKLKTQQTNCLLLQSVVHSQ